MSMGQLLVCCVFPLVLASSRSHTLVHFRSGVASPWLFTGRIWVQTFSQNGSKGTCFCAVVPCGGAWCQSCVQVIPEVYFVWLVFWCYVQRPYLTSEFFAPFLTVLTCHFSPEVLPLLIQPVANPHISALPVSLTFLRAVSVLSLTLAQVFSVIKHVPILKTSLTDSCSVAVIFSWAWKYPSTLQSCVTGRQDLAESCLQRK